MTTTEKIEAIKAISMAISMAMTAFGTFDAKSDAMAKLSEIIDSLDPTCKCKTKCSAPVINTPIFCNSTADSVSLQPTAQDS